MSVVHGPRGDDSAHALISRETVRALWREHRDLILSLRALTTLLRDPDMNDAESEQILARILDAELQQVAVLDGELITALQLETGDVGPVQPFDLGRTLRAAARRSGRLMVVETRGAVPVTGHERIAQQTIESALSLAHRIADGPVRAWAEARAGGGSVKVSTVVGPDSANLERDERVALLHRLVRADGGRFVIERTANDGLVLHLTFYDRR